MAFRLIQRFAVARGLYLSLGKLIQDVWFDKEVSDEAVQRQVSTLRAKLRAAGVKGIEFQSGRKNSPSSPLVLFQELSVIFHADSIILPRDFQGPRDNPGIEALVRVRRITATFS